MQVELTQEQKRVMIAKVCPFVTRNLKGEYLWVHRGAELRFDPFADLNACAEMERALEADEQIERYLDVLTDVCGGDVPRFVASFTAYFATAAQRAEAFGKTMGLW